MGVSPSSLALLHPIFGVIGKRKRAAAAPATHFVGPFISLFLDEMLPELMHLLCCILSTVRSLLRSFFGKEACCMGASEYIA